MRRGRIFFYLAFILILGLVAVYVISQRYLQPAANMAGEGGEVQQPVVVNTVDVVVVTQKVSRGTVLDETVLGLVPLPEENVVTGMLTDIASAAGRQAMYDLQAGILLTEGMLVDPSEQLAGSGSVAALSIPPGMVAVSIPIDRLSSVSYAPRAGDHVNVILTTSFIDVDADFQTPLPNLTGVVISPGPMSDPVQLSASLQDGTHGRAEIDPVLGQTFYLMPSGEPISRQVSQTLLQDVVVLHMGNFPLKSEKAQDTQTAEPIMADPAGQTPPQGEAADEPVIPEVITLVVTPQDAVTLNYLVAQGARLTLALRSAGDASRVETESVTLQFLLDQYNIQIPAKLPYSMDNSGYKPEPVVEPVQ